MENMLSVLRENKLVLQGALKACLAKIEAAVNVITDKKLVAYCLIAVIIGAATIVPLGLYLITQLDKEPQFNIDVSYAYVDNYWDNDTAKIQKNYGLVYAVTFDVITKHNFRQFPFIIFPYADVVTEYYSIELLSEKGSIGNLTYSVSQRAISARTFYPYNRTVFPEVSQSTGTAGSLNGTFFGYIEGSTKNLDTSLGKPDSITITVRREGWLISKNNSTTVHLADQKIIAQVELQRYGDGFIYNKLFSQEQLSRINPVMPQYEVL
jgi:hypothetical protein